MKNSNKITYKQLKHIVRESLSNTPRSMSLFDWLDGDMLIMNCEPKWTVNDEKSLIEYVNKNKDPSEAKGGSTILTGQEYRQLLKNWASETGRKITVLGKRVAEMYGDDPGDYKTDKNGNYLRDKNGRKIPRGFEDDIRDALDKVRGLTSRLKDNIINAIFNPEPKYSMEESAFVDGQEIEDVGDAFKAGDKRSDIMNQIVPGETILYYYWSYDCAMCHFVKVEKKSGARLYVRPMRNKIVKGNFMWGEVVPDENADLGELQVARVDRDGTISLGKYSHFKSDLSIWNGEPKRHDASR